MLFGFNAVSGGNTYATLDPSNKGTNATLSSGNLNLVSSSGYSSARSTISKTSGKWYWECTVTSPSSNMFGGVAQSTSNLNSYAGIDAVSWGFDYENPTFYKWYNSGATALNNPTPLVTGDVIGFALDMGGGTLQVYVNNISQGNHAGITGTVFAQGSTNSTGSNLYNFGATAFTYSPPATYNSGLYT